MKDKIVEFLQWSLSVVNIQIYTHTQLDNQLTK